MTIALGLDLVNEICELFQLPAEVTGVSLHIECDALAELHVRQLVTEEQSRKLTTLLRRYSLVEARDPPRGGPPTDTAPPAAESPSSIPRRSGFREFF